MLARGTRSVYICLRCQKPQFPNQRKALRFPNTAATSVIRRWQSAATNRVADDEVEYSHHTDSATDNQAPPTGNRQENQSQTHNDHPSWRRWIPDSTAQLGVNSLGKPAEVLLLPSRDRVITQAPKGEEKGSEGTGTSIQESIESEKVPLSGTNLAENLEQVRLLVGKMRGQLELSEWIMLRTHLRKGFTVSQIWSYIGMMKEGPIPPPGMLKPKDKVHVARYLAEEVWGFVLPGRIRDKPLPSSVPVKQYYRTNTSKLEFMVKHHAQPLKKIAEKWDVKVEAHIRRCTITIPGTKGATKGALQAISDYATQLESIHIALQEIFGPVNPENHAATYVDEFLENLERKYNELSFVRLKEVITITHLQNNHTADQARREILLSAPATADAPYLIIWPNLKESATSLQPCPAPPEVPPWMARNEWQRLVSHKVASPLTNQSKGLDCFDKTLQRLQELLAATFRSDSSRTASSPGLYYETTAKFGQALTQALTPLVELNTSMPLTTSEVIAKGERQETGSMSDNTSRPIVTGPAQETRQKSSSAPIDRFRSSSTSGPASATSKETEVSRVSLSPKTREYRHFAGGVPFAAHHLTRMRPWTEQSSHTDKQFEGGTRATLRLKLCPVPSKALPRSPVYEIFVAADAEVEGKQQPLRVVRVTAIHHEQHFLVMCPENDVDVDFAVQWKQNLTPSKTIETADMPVVLAAVRKYVANVRTTSGSDWVFGPFLSIPSYPTPAGVPRSKHKPNRELKRSAKDGVDQEVEYYLRTVDVVDVDSRLIPHNCSAFSLKPEDSKVHPNSKFCLDHITYTGADATRQELRLAKRPLLHTPTVAPPHLPRFLNAALNLSAQFSGKPESADRELMYQDFATPYLTARAATKRAEQSIADGTTQNPARDGPEAHISESPSVLVVEKKGRDEVKRASKLTADQEASKRAHAEATRMEKSKSEHKAQAVGTKESYLSPGKKLNYAKKQQRPGVLTVDKAKPQKKGQKSDIADVKTNIQRAAPTEATLDSPEEAREGTQSEQPQATRKGIRTAINQGRRGETTMENTPVEKPNVKKKKTKEMARKEVQSPTRSPREEKRKKKEETQVEVPPAAIQSVQSKRRAKKKTARNQAGKDDKAEQVEKAVESKGTT